MAKKTKKHFLMSKTVLGAFLTVFATVAPEVISVEEADTAYQLILQLAGLSLAVYGRFKATEGLRIK
jgi:hypothetical protein